jgi:hypothetical protein
MMKYIVEVYDVNGNLLYKCENPQKEVIRGPITIVNDKFVRNDTVILKCIAENAVYGEPQEPVEPAGE